MQVRAEKLNFFYMPNLALTIEIINALFYILAVWRIIRVCRINPRRIKTFKFDEDDYLVNGVIFGPIINDIYYLTVGLFYTLVKDTHHYDTCSSVIKVPGMTNTDIFAVSIIMVVQRNLFY